MTVFRNVSLEIPTGDRNLHYVRSANGTQVIPDQRRWLRPGRSCRFNGPNVGPPASATSITNALHTPTGSRLDAKGK